jgi:hypothetical protein
MRSTSTSRCKFAHAADDRLSGVIVALHREGGVLLGQRSERPAHLVLVGLGPWLDCDMDDRQGELQLLEHDRVVRRTEGVAGAGVLEADASHDVSGPDVVAVLTVVGVHLEDPADPFLGTGSGIQHGRSLVEGAAVSPEVDELADVGVGHDLECQSGKRRLVVDEAFDRVARPGVDSLDRGKIQGRRKVLDHRVQ